MEHHNTLKVTVKGSSDRLRTENPSSPNSMTFPLHFVLAFESHFMTHSYDSCHMGKKPSSANRLNILFELTPEKIMIEKLSQTVFFNSRRDILEIVTLTAKAWLMMAFDFHAKSSEIKEFTLVFGAI